MGCWVGVDDGFGSVAHGRQGCVDAAVVAESALVCRWHGVPYLLGVHGFIAGGEDVGDDLAFVFDDVFFS